MVVILSDIHSNLTALKAVLSDMPKEASEIWVLGDTIGELPFPCEVLDILGNLQIPVVSVAGNREFSLLEAKSGKHPDWWMGTQMRALAWTTDKLLPHHWEYLKSLLHPMNSNSIQQGALLVHGSPHNVRGIITTQEQAISAIHGISQRVLVCGHTHKSRIFRIKSHTVINAGSVGISLDGICGVACYAILDEHSMQDDNPIVVLRHVTYDVEDTIKKLQDSELFVLAPGISKASILELRTGRPHVMSLLDFCNSYAERYLGHPVETVPINLWKEAEKLWDGSEWMKGRLQ